VVQLETGPVLFKCYHTSPLGGHLGVFKTIQKIRENFIWKAMDNDISARVRSCTVCEISTSALNTRFGLLASEVASRPFQKLFVDYVGKIPRSKAGNTMLLVCVDSFSKFVWLAPAREATSEATIRVLKDRIFSKFSVPNIVVSDNVFCLLGV
jgi:hypothetical protein